MKRLISTIFRLLCLGAVVAFLISCFTQYIPPHKFSFITLFSVAFPYLFVLIAVLALMALFINRRWAVFLFISLLFGYTNLVHTIAFNKKQWQAQKKDSSIRIMTWNVEDFVNLLKGSEVRHNMLALISKNNPDILCVQEFTEVQGGKWRISVTKELDSMGYRYHFYSNDQITTNINDVHVIRGAAIFSKQKFIDSSRINIRNTTMSENLVYATFLFNNKPFRVYTAHLASFELYRDTTATNSRDEIYKVTYHRKKVIQYQLRATGQLHEKEVAIIKNAIAKSSYPVVYCGDANTTPCSYIYRALKGNLQDAFLQKGSGIGQTFYKLLFTLRIDYCFADKQFTVDQCRVISRKLSDHYPVVTDISWK